MTINSQRATTNLGLGHKESCDMLFSYASQQENRLYLCPYFISQSNSMHSNWHHILLYTVSPPALLYVLLPIICPSPFSEAISIWPPHFLLSPSISFLFLSLSLCMWPDFLYRCLHAYRCVCVPIIECHYCGQASSQSYFCHFFFSLSFLPPRSSHLSFHFCFLFLSVLLPSPSCLRSSTPYFLAFPFLVIVGSLLFLISCSLVLSHSLSLCSVS